MPVLPSFINKGRNKFKVATNCKHHPFGSLRPNIPTLHPFGFSEVIDIHDKSTSQLEGSEESVSKSSLDLENDERYEPLDLSISPEPLMSSFPPRFLKNSYIHPADAGPFYIRDKDHGKVQLMLRRWRTCRLNH